MGGGSILDGMLAGIEDAYFQKEIADAAFRYQQLLEAGQKVIVGVNRFTRTIQESPDLLIIGPDIEEGQNKAVAEVKANRDEHAAQAALAALRSAAGDESVNTLPVMIEAAKAYVTLGEMTEALRRVWGRYTEPPAF